MELHFAGLNIWTYSDNRAIVWLGLKGSHFGDSNRRHLKYERGRAGNLGIEVVVGGEEREITLVLGLLITTFYIGITRLVPKPGDKLKRAAEAQNMYTYQLDYAYEGRRTGVALSFGECGGLEFSLWVDDMSETRRSLWQKFRFFPYCEGIRKKIYWR